MGHVARVAMAIRNGKRLHQMPAREIGGADVTDLAGADDLVERRQGFLDGRIVVLTMQLEEIDAVRSEPPQRPVDGLDQVLAGRA